MVTWGTRPPRKQIQISGPGIAAIGIHAAHPRIRRIAENKGRGSVVDVERVEVNEGRTTVLGWRAGFSAVVNIRRSPIVNMTISKKLFSGFGALLAIILLIGGIAVRNIGNLGDSMSLLGHHYVHALALTGDINYLTSDMLATSRGILIRGHMKDLEKAKEYNGHFEEDVDRVRKEATEFAEGTKYPELRDIASNEILGRLDSLSKANSTMYDLILKGDIAGADSYQAGTLIPIAKEVGNAGAHLAQLETTSVTAYADEAISSVTPVLYLSGAMIFLALGVAAVVVFVVRSISKTLTESISELRDGADQVADAASQVSSSSQSLAQGSSEQAASLEETSASSEEINSMARRNTDNSRSTAQLLAKSLEKVTLANRYLGEMVQSMDEITESSGKISKIIKVIDEIAFQTNILALNAAVEAARAGEAGMGFAVVADEVRSLAQRSAQAAKDTTTLIEDSIAKSSEGKGKVDQVAMAIKAVTEDTTRIKVMVDEVSLGSEEQSRGIDQIGRAISQMEQVTQTTAASAEESAAAAEELNAQSQTMQDVVSRLHAMVSDSSDSRPAQRIASHPSRNNMRPAPTPYRSASRPRVSASAASNSSRDSEFPMEESFQTF